MKSTPSVTTDHSISKLEEAFGIFNQVSADLGSSFQNLELRVASLKEELAASNSARIKELTEKEQLASKLSALMEALPGGVVVVNTFGLVKDINPAAGEIIGKSFIGENWESVIRQISQVTPGYNGEFSSFDGKRVSISSSGFGDDGDKIILLTDITENYRLNNILNREKRLAALGEMAARLAHQVRTPLSSAILYLSNLASQLKINQSQSAPKTIKNIHGQLAQIEKMVEGMLSYINGDISANQSFSALALLEEVYQATALQVKASGGSLELDYLGENFEINGDKDALFNALTNLIVNAIQASTGNALIKLSLRQETDCVRLEVSDNGPGIDEAIRDQIFDPFFSTREGGTGLGLAVVMSAVNAHRGEVTISNPPDGGTVFTLTIPKQQLDLETYIGKQA